MSGQHKDTRPLTVDAYIRLWTYMTKAEQVYALCWFHAFHESVNKPKPLQALFWALFLTALSKLGIAGAVASALLEYLKAITGKDVFECDKLLQVKPPPKPGGKPAGKGG